MRIAVISAADIPSTRANSVQVMKTCQALLQLGHTARLYLPANGKSAVAPADEMSRLRQHYGVTQLAEILRLKTEPRWKRYDFAWRSVQAAQRWGADLVETRLLQAAVFAGLHKIPVLLELHGPPEGILGPWLFRLFLAMPVRKRLLLITHGLKHLLENHYGNLAPARPVVHPNGVDLDRWTAIQPESGFDPTPTGVGQEHARPFKAVYTGHLYAGRGMELLANLADRFPTVIFEWVGGQPQDVAAWQTQLAARNLANVRLTGFIPNSELPRYQAAADVLLMPYEHKISGSSGGNSAAYASPMKMFEYMASGKAIISSDLPVLHEVLNENNCIFCPPSDLEAWSQALQRLIEQPFLRARLGEQARQDVQRFTWQARLKSALAGLLEEDS
jgi:glycosyltransferase involved in cell wall biosynthesis